MLNYNLVLKRGELFTAGDIETDGSRESATGLYFRDTRHLSAFELTIDGVTPEVLSVSYRNASSATVILSNRLIERPLGDVHPQRLLIVQNVALDDSLNVELTVQNFDSRQIACQVDLLLAADFRDLFDIRGFHRDRRGRWLRPKAHARGLELGYVGLDGRRTGTSIGYDQDCTVTPCTTTADIRDGSFLYLGNTEHGQMLHELLDVPAACLTFDLDLAPHERWVANFAIDPQSASAWPEAPDRVAERSALVSSDHAQFNRILDQCQADLDALQTTFPHGALPAAGVPWFVAPFGRDSLITSLQTLHLSPERAIATVRTLAALQGATIDPSRAEEPGKILHEMRYGEMARIGEVPHSPYYGSVDATPLWLWLLAESVIWTGDGAMLDELMPEIRAALTWIEQCGDLDGDGFVEYRTDAEGIGHITHQVWKDSFDSLNHVDGKPAPGPVAAVEVQGYVYAAYSRLALAAGERCEWATDLAARAERLRARIEDRFWLDDEAAYAQALDGDKDPVAVVSSNAGQLLACGVPSPARAALLAKRLLRNDLSCGWGLRTLSGEAASYNPMSYHNGSIWPHDNSLIGAGLYRYGEVAAGHAVTGALLDAAATMPFQRLPELYCGFQREGIAEHRPVDYPVSCSPQAWASGALPLLVRAMLGLEVDPETRELIVAPELPAWLNELTIEGLRVVGCEGMLTVRRAEEGYAIEAPGLPLRRGR